MIALLSWILFFTYTSVYAQNSVSISNCNPESVFEITKLAFDPANPIPGQNGTLILDYTVPYIITSGSVHYTCNYNGLPIYDQIFDLCSQTSCPIVVGVHNDNTISPIPNASGKVTCTIQWFDTTDHELLCINMALKLV